jgi:hypothetical protein
MKQDKIDLALFDCYRELFAGATPYGDFDKLVEVATLNERGQKEIPFDNYEIDEDLFQQIITETLKKHKVPKSLHRSFSIAIHLGCSPRFTRKENAK